MKILKVLGKILGIILALVIIVWISIQIGRNIARSEELGDEIDNGGAVYVPSDGGTEEQQEVGTYEE